VASRPELRQECPRPTGLNSVSVTIGTSLAPLSYVSPTQVNAFIPYEVAAIAAGQMATVALVVTSPAGSSAPFQLQLSKSAPAIFSKEGTGTGAALAFDPFFSPLTSLTSTVIIFYANGLGPTTPPILTSGLAASNEPFNRVRSKVSVSVGESPATILFAGLAPGLQGIYQCQVVRSAVRQFWSSRSMVLRVRPLLCHLLRRRRTLPMSRVGSAVCIPHRVAFPPSARP